MVAVAHHRLPEAPSASMEVYANRDLWLAARMAGIGGSDAAVLWGVSPYASLFSLWASKVHGGAPLDAEWLEIGAELEEPIARIYARRTQRTLFDPGRTTIYTSKRWPWMFASLDRIAVDAGRVGLVEVKNRGAFGAHDWRRDGVPVDVQLQVQHQLAVTGFGWASVAVLIGGNRFAPIDIERDEELIAMHVEKCRAFWHDYVLPARAPEVDGTEATRVALARIFPAENGDEIALDDEAAKWAEVYHQAHADEKAAKERKDEADNHIRAALGFAAVGRLPDGRGFSLKTIPGGPVSYVREPYRKLTPLKAKKRKEAR